MDHREIVATYGAAWSEPDDAKRAALLEASFAEDGHYHDPTATAVGRAALVAHIGGYQEMLPGHSIDITSGVDSNGAELRWAWTIRKGDTVVLEGIDFAELAADGRIQRIAGFFGPLPPLGS